MIYICAITVGVMSYYMADRKHRKAFLEARQSLEVKLNLEEQSQQQVSGPIEQGSWLCVSLMIHKYVQIISIFSQQSEMPS